MTFQKIAKQFDSKGEVRRVIDEAKDKRQEFLMRYPLDSDPSFIDKMQPDDFYNPGSNDEYFFWWLEHPLAPLGRMRISYDTGLRNIRDNIAQFKVFLHKLLDPEISLSEKIDIPIEQEIKHLGGQKLVIKKILSVYDDSMIPIFSIDHLYHFFERVVGSQSLPRNYDSLSMGKKYEVLMRELLQKKEESKITKDWDNYYFMKFLYSSYPLSQRPTQSQPISLDKLHAYGLTSEPDCEQEVVFLFAKMHGDLGFPVVTKVQTAFPDVYAQDEQRNPVSIELEHKASGYEIHARNGLTCDFVVCWEDDEGERWPAHWPRLISLRDDFVSE